MRWESGFPGRQFILAWAQAVAFGIFDAQSSGALLYWDLLPIPKTVEQDDYGQFAPGALVVKEG